MVLRLVLLGAPGSGKGTQAAKMMREWNIAHVSTGDILREAISTGSKLGREAAGFMNVGRLVPDEVVIGLVEERLEGLLLGSGFVLDGFPRTIPQAQMLEGALAKKLSPLQVVIHLKVATDELVRRLSGRRVCPKCGQLYHVDSLPKTGTLSCLKDGSELVQRPDDAEEAVRVRLRTYLDQTEPLCDFYQQKGLLRTIEGMGSPEQIFDEIKQIVRGLS